MTVTITERAQLEKLVVLMFNAAPGAGYLAQMVGLYEASGHNLQGVADALDDVAPFQVLHPNFQTSAEFAADFLSPLGLQNDATAKSFVVEKFNAGVSKGEIMFLGLQALGGLAANAPPQYLAARAILENKAAVAEYYSVTKGISNTDVGILQSVLNGVTSDAASVASAEAEIDAGTRGVQGVTTTQSESQDTIIGTNAADLVNGLFGGGSAAATLTPGDTIDGGSGSDRVNLVATGTAPSAPVIIKNVETINIQDTVGATFNALLVENDPAINFTSTQAGKTSTVINAALGSVIGLAGKGNLLADYANTSGSADTAKLALNGAGSAASPSTVDLGDGDTVEAVTVVTSGTNFVNLLAGTAAGTVTISGNGTNTFAVGSIKAVATIDASASTGANTFNLGNTVGNSDVLKGGSGDDTATFATSSALGTVTFNGVETVKADIDADVALNLGTSTGLKTLTFSDGSGSLQITNATSELTTVNYASTTAADVDNDFSLAYKTGQTGKLVFNLGSASAVQPLTLDELSFTRVQALAINALGDEAIAIASGIQLDNTTQALAVNVGASGSFELSGAIELGDHSALKDITLSTSDDAHLIVVVDAPTALGTAVTVTAGPESSLIANVAAGSLDPMSITADAGASIYVQAVVDRGGIGDVTLSMGSGSVGALNVLAEYAGANEYGDFDISLASGATLESTVSVTGRDIGDVSLKIGADASAHLAAQSVGGEDGSGRYVSGGNIGDVRIDLTGDSAAAVVSFYAAAGYPGSDGGGGNLGDVFLIATGDDAHLDATLTTDGGSQGNYDIDIGASGSVLLRAVADSTHSDGTETSTVGDITVRLGVGTTFDGRWIANLGGVGNVQVDAADKTDTSIAIPIGDEGLGAFALTAGDNANFVGTFSSLHGSIGPVTLVAGEQSVFSVGIGIGGGELGPISMIAGENSIMSIGVDAGAPTEPITAAGGLGGSAILDLRGEGPFGLIDLHEWLGIYSVTAHETGGVVVFGGVGGGVIDGGDGGADQLTGGAGADWIDGFGGDDLLDGGAGNDVLLGGWGADLIDGGDGNDIIKGGRDLDVMTGGAGADAFVFDNFVSAAFTSAAVTDVIVDFATKSDTLALGAAGDATNFFANPAPAATLAVLLQAANAKLDGTLQYYFGVVEGNGYLVQSLDGLSADQVIQLSGVSSIAMADLVAL